MVIKRGEIWWANLPAPQGSEPGYRRPVVIVQSDDFNQSLIQTAIAVVLTSNVNLARAPGNVFLSAKISGLPKDSVANVSQIITLDKSFLSELISSVPQKLLREIENGLRLVLEL